MAWVDVIAVAAALEAAMEAVDGGSMAWPDLSSVTVEMSLPTGAKL